MYKRLCYTGLVTLKANQGILDMKTREQWAKAALDLIAAEIIQPHTNQPKPPYRVSVAMLAPKTLGECFPRSRSADGHNEIFIAAHTDDSMQHLATLTHELIHAYDDCQSGHRGEFARLARIVGLEGPLTATHAGADLNHMLEDIRKDIGDIPHAEISKKPKDKGRNSHKLTCLDCGFKANTSRKWVRQVADGFECPACFSNNTRVQ